MPPALVVRFADETDVFGLHLFNTRRSKFEVIFWCSFVLIFLCYTAKTLVSIVEKYVEEETLSRVYKTRAENISFPFAELCVYAGRPVLEPLPIEMAVQSVVDALEKKSADLNASAFAAVMDFLHQLQMAENEAGLPSKGVLDTNAPLGVFNASVLAGLGAVAKHAKTPIAHLFDILLLELCHSFQIEITFRDSELSNVVHTLEKVCEHGYPAIMINTPLSFCIHLSGADYVYRTGIQELRVTFNTRRARANLGVGPSVDAQLWLGGRIAQNQNTEEFESTIFISLGKVQIHEVRINVEHRLLDLRRRRCTEEGDARVWCKTRCRSEFFYAAYGCWPMLYRDQFSPRRQNMSNVQACSVDHYLNSNRLTSPDALQRGFDCADACYDPCVQRTYFVTSLDYLGLSASDVDPQSATARVFVESFAYSVVEERLVNDFESLLSNVGGALGLFLGMSFASVVHIPLFMLQAVIGYLQGKCMKPTEKKQNDVEVQTISHDANYGERLDAMNNRLESVENAISAVNSTIQQLAMGLRDL